MSLDGNRSSAGALWGIVLLVWGVASGFSAVVTWDGGGGDGSWQNASNWSADTLPGANDEVIISVPGSLKVTSSANVTILSLHCTNDLALSGGLFRVRSGSSVIQGELTTTGNPVLSVTGAVTSLTVAGAVLADGAGFEVVDGQLSLPGMSGYSKGPGCATVNWLASGITGLIDLPGLTVLTGASCATLSIQAIQGGRILLTNLATSAEGVTRFSAEGASSLVDMPALQVSTGVQRGVAFEARDGGVLWMPQFAGGRTVTVSLRTGGFLPVAQLTELSGFTVSGTNADFAGLTNLTLGSITVENGGVARATNVVTHADSGGCAAHTWAVDGDGSVLDLSGLMELASAPCWVLNLMASSGGTLVLSNLATVSEGRLTFVADGANSTVDLGGLERCTATALVAFEARNSGALLLPRLPGGPAVFVTLASGGSLPVAQLSELSGFAVSGMAVSFSALTNLGTGSVTVSDGGTVSLPGLVHHVEDAGCYGHSWTVSGQDSVLEFSELLSITGPGCGYLEVTASGGGRVLLAKLASVANGTIFFEADGAGSTVDLGQLQSSPGGTRTVSFEARNQGSMLMPGMPGGPTVEVVLAAGGTLPVGQLVQLRGFTVAGMEVEFPGLTTLGQGSVTVSGGGKASLPGIRHHDESTGCPQNLWLATGPGSLLDFPALTNLVGGQCGFLNVHAIAGGACKFAGLTMIGDGTLNFLADGADSLVDLSALRESRGTTRPVGFEARNHGRIAMPSLNGGPTVTVAIKSGGLLDAGQITLLKGATVSGTNLVMAGLTNLFAGDLIVEEGGRISLPGLGQFEGGPSCGAHAWLADGIGSVLELPALTNLSGPNCGTLSVMTVAGGRVVLTNLQQITDGNVSFAADGTGSLTELDSLRKSLGTSGRVGFEAGNGGAIRMPLMTGGPTVGLNIRTNGNLTVEALTRLKTVQLVAAQLSLPALTNLDGGWFALSNGAALTAPVLPNYARGPACESVNPWIVDGGGSVLHLPGLRLLTGGTCVSLETRALNGGQVLMENLASIPSGQAVFFSSGPGSLIDLRSTTNFVNSATLSQLIATNGGTIILPPVAVFSGVAFSIEGGATGLPRLDLPGTNTLLRGMPWHSYWVEHRPLSPGAEWAFFRRVPLTNEFQVIAPRARPNTECRAWEFIADPYALELTYRPGAGVLPVLYAPENADLEVETASNLAPPVVWEFYGRFLMTNTFRILPPEGFPTAERYFRVRRL